MAPDRTRIFGVDFSGAQTPGQSIWITEATYHDDGLEVKDCQSAEKRFSLDAGDPRDTVYDHLRELIHDHPDGVFGFDFPFSLPSSVITDADSWPAYLETLKDDFGEATAEEFRQECAARAGPDRADATYLRRETDWRYGGQCPYQYQIQSQTFYGQRDLLRPLATGTDTGACALPMQERDPDLPWLLEVYPAATLGVLRLYRQGYKSHQESELRREQNITGLRKQGVDIDDEVASNCRESDDAHDSLVAAHGVVHAFETDFKSTGIGPDIEGQIFA